MMKNRVMKKEMNELYRAMQIVDTDNVYDEDGIIIGVNDVVLKKAKPIKGIRMKWLIKRHYIDIENMVEKGWLHQERPKFNSERRYTIDSYEGWLRIYRV